MIRGMYSAISGLRTHQTMLDVVSNNLANVNTVGYKSSRVTFKDQLQQTLYGGSAEGPNTGGTNSAQVGLGVQLGSIDAVMSDGSMQATGTPLDVAVQGDSFFRVGIGDPSTTPATMPTEMNYTRAGNFIRNDQGYVTARGLLRHGPRRDHDAGLRYLHPDPGRRVRHRGWHQRRRQLRPGRRRRAHGRGHDQPRQVPQRRGAAAALGQPLGGLPSAGTLQIGTPDGTTFVARRSAARWKMSNVDLASEFTSMIVAQRGFQANSKVISTSDEMLQGAGQPQALARLPPAESRHGRPRERRRAFARAGVP